MHCLKETIISLIVDFSTEILKASRKGNDIFKALKEKTVNLKFDIKQSFLQN